MKDYRAILGVSQDATPREIRRAYLDTIKFLHPDQYEIGSLEWEDANKRLSEVNEAYRHLKEETDRYAGLRGEAGEAREASATPPRPPWQGARPGKSARQPRGEARHGGRQMDFLSGEDTVGLREATRRFLADIRDGRVAAVSLVVVLLFALFVWHLNAMGVEIYDAGFRVAYLGSAPREGHVMENGEMWRQRATEGWAEIACWADVSGADNVGYFDVKFVPSIAGRNCIRYFLHAGKRTTIRLPAGSYTVLYAYGKRWSGSGLGRMAVYYKATAPLQVSGAGEAVPAVRIELRKNFDSYVEEAARGRGRAVRISESEFERYNRYEAFL